MELDFEIANWNTARSIADDVNSKGAFPEVTKDFCSDSVLSLLDPHLSQNGVLSRLRDVCALFQIANPRQTSTGLISSRPLGSTVSCPLAEAAVMERALSTRSCTGRPTSARRPRERPTSYTARRQR